MSHPLIRTALPPVTTALCRQMQSTLYRYVWRVSATQQVRLCLLSLAIAPLTFLPLELQRRMVNDAIETPNIDLLFLLGSAYLGILLLNAVLKFVRNAYQGVIAEGVIRVLRLRVAQQDGTAEGAANHQPAGNGNGDGDGARVSMAAAEAEQLGGFVAESLATPLLELLTLVFILGYMLTIEPLIAAYTVLLAVPVLIVVPRVQKVINGHIERRLEIVRQLGDGMANPDDPEVVPNDKPEEFDRMIQAIYTVRVRIILLRNFLKVFNRFFNNIGPLGVLIIGGILVIQGETQLGTIVAFISGYDRLRAPSRELLAFYRLQSRMRTQFRMFREGVT